MLKECSFSQNNDGHGGDDDDGDDEDDVRLTVFKA